MDIKLVVLKENLLLILGSIAVVIGFFALFFYGENLRIAIYALLFHLAIYALIIRKYFKNHLVLSHIFSFFICYLVLQIIWGASPKLQLKEFEWTHPNWQVASQVQLVDVQSDIYRRSRSVSYAYMNVIYQYEYQGKLYSTEQSDLARQYSMLLIDEPPELRKLSEFKLKKEFLDGQEIVLVNTTQPQESVYFYSQSWFDLRGSWLAKILWGLQLISIGVLLVLFGFIIKKTVNPNNTIQTWSKPKRYIFIVVFFLLSWSVLFAGWILFMYVKNSP